MNDASHKDYGFTYRHAGRTFALSVHADSAEEARERVRSMASAEFVGLMEECVAESPLPATVPDGGPDGASDHSPAVPEFMRLREFQPVEFGGVL